MAHSLSFETDLMQLLSQFAANLAQARSLDACAAQCIRFVEAQVAPRACQFIWGVGPSARPLASATQIQLRQPDAEQRGLLNAGKLAPVYVHGQTVAYFAPLIARAELLGWLYVDRPAEGVDSAALIAMIAMQIGPVLALLDTSLRREDRLAQLHTLNEIGRLLSGVLDLDTLLDQICSATRRLVDAPIFYIAFFDDRTDQICLAYIAQDGVRQARQERWTKTVGLAGIVIRERQPIYADDYAAECVRRNVAPRPFEHIPEARAWLGVPLIAHDHLIGIMNVSSYRKGYSYSEEHVDVLTTIAAQAAVAIENARLYQRSERQANQLATLNQISRTLTSSLDPERVPELIIAQVTQLLNVEEGSLLLVDQATGDLVFAYTTAGPIGQRLLGQRLAPGTGVAGYVMAYGESVIINDAQHDQRFDNSTDKATGFVTRTMLAVPLRGMGGVQGVIEALNRRDDAPFTLEDQYLLESLSDQAVIALENARRFAQVDQALARRAQELVRTNLQLEHNLRSLTALNALGMAINTTLRGADEIFGMTARGVVEMTGALGAVVLLADHERGGFRLQVQIGPTLTPPSALLELLQQVMVTGRLSRLAAGAAPSLTQIGARTALVVPLRATQKTFGGLCVYYSGAEPDAPNEETVVLFATQAAVAVESIELLNTVRSGRDQMASILASTREGIMLITPDARVAIANASLHQLCGLQAQIAQNSTVEQFLDNWEATIAYSTEEWAALRQGLSNIMLGRDSFASGELNERGAHPRSIEWAALTAQGSGASNGGALLVLRDITDAKESERLRQDLTNMIVHDLRSPLSSVMAAIELMTKGVAGEVPPKQLSVLSIAYHSSIQMLDMINALLDISRLEAGRMPLELKPSAVRPLIERAVERLDALAHERNILIQVDIPDTLAMVLADADLIVRVLQNLIANALKFSGSGSTVLLRAFPTPLNDQHTAYNAQVSDPSVASLTITVVDCGVGIAPEDQEKIFAKFGQVGERRGGTGLGLTFCKLVIEAHAGHIWVESTPGAGSIFSFTLPTAPEHMTTF